MPQIAWVSKGSHSNIPPDSKPHRGWACWISPGSRAGHTPDRNPGSSVLAKVPFGDLELPFLHAHWGDYQPSSQDSKALPELLLEEKPMAHFIQEKEMM